MEREHLFDKKEEQERRRGAFFLWLFRPRKSTFAMLGVLLMLAWLLMFTDIDTGGVMENWGRMTGQSWLIGLGARLSSAKERYARVADDDDLRNQGSLSQLAYLQQTGGRRAASASPDLVRGDADMLADMVAAEKKTKIVHDGPRALLPEDAARLASEVMVGAREGKGGGLGNGSPLAELQAGSVGMAKGDPSLFSGAVAALDERRDALIEFANPFGGRVGAGAKSSSSKLSGAFRGSRQFAVNGSSRQEPAFGKLYLVNLRHARDVSAYAQRSGEGTDAHALASEPFDGNKTGIKLASLGFGTESVPELGSDAMTAPGAVQLPGAGTVASPEHPQEPSADDLRSRYTQPSTVESLELQVDQAVQDFQRRLHSMAVSVSIAQAMMASGLPPVQAVGAARWAQLRSEMSSIQAEGDMVGQLGGRLGGLQQADVGGQFGSLGDRMRRAANSVWWGGIASGGQRDVQDGVDSLQAFQSERGRQNQSASADEKKQLKIADTPVAP